MELMSLDLTLLKLFKHRDRIERLLRAVPKGVCSPQTDAILMDYKLYFEQHPDTKAIPIAEFLTWFKLRHPTLKPEQMTVYEHQLTLAQQEVSPEVEAGLMERLVAAETALRLAELIQEWNEGKEVDLYVRTRSLVEDFEARTHRKVKVPWVEDKIEDLLKAEADDTGLHWRQKILNLSMRPLRGGDFGVLAGRPDKGKTTMLTDNLTHMAPQVAQMYGNQQHIIWLNNEGPGKRIIQRLYQSALNLTIPELVELVQKPAPKGSTHKHMLDHMYAAAMGGRLDLIRVFDIHDFWSHEVEDLLRKIPWGLAVFDMVDNIKFGGGASNGGERTDQLLEAMYQWTRVLSVKYDRPILATSQVSADGDGMQFPTLSMLKDSKTGKQGAAEFILTIGASNDPGMQHSRFFGLTKNKLHRHGGPKDPRAEVLFDGERGRYNEPTTL